MEFLTILEIEKIEGGGWIRFGIHNDYVKLTEGTVDKLDRLDSDYINENFGVLQDEAYEAGRKAEQEEAIKWRKRNEEDAYNAGLNDAWELAKKIALSTNMVKTARIFIAKNICGIEQIRLLEDCFALTPQEALAKLEAYEKEQAEIKVGDVVRFKRHPSCEALITAISRGLNGIHLQTDDLGRIGEVNSGICRENIEKTGKHIDIQSILQQIATSEKE